MSTGLSVITGALGVAVAKPNKCFISIEKFRYYKLIKRGGQCTRKEGENCLQCQCMAMDYNEMFTCDS